MKEPMVITMAREYASGGSEIAQAVADKLGIPLYNKELITLAAKKSGLTEEAIAASENQRSGSLIYSLYMMGNTMPLADQVYILQSNVIKELAAEGPCVILGRCGDYVLRERPNVLRTFVYAPLETRIQFAKSRPDAKDMPDRLWETQLAKHDRARASYYNYYTENRWGEAKNYDLCLNATLGREACADLIVAAAKAMQAALAAELEKSGLAGQGYKLNVSISEYAPGNAFARWLMPGMGGTYLKTRTSILDGDDKTVAVIPVNRTVAAGGGFTIGAWRECFGEVATEIVKVLKREMGILPPKKEEKSNEGVSL